MILTTQTYLGGMFVEVEITYDFDPELSHDIDLQGLYILGYYPEGDLSHAVQRGDYFPLNAIGNVEYLSADDAKSLRESCMMDYLQSVTSDDF